MAHWYVYCLRCSDGSIYTGITTDLERRLKAHNAGKGAACTRARLPVTLLYHEAFSNRSEASIREAAIKRLSKVEKEALIVSKST